MIKQSLNAKVVLILVAIFLLSGAAFGAFYHRFEHDAEVSLMLAQSKALFRQIQLTRHWNANYGGVYVLKRQGMQTNPYLYEVGPKEGEKAAIKPEIIDLDGNVYTLKNPALMARELSELSRARSDIGFHLTSLKPINPNNIPDPFEKRALEAFQAGTTELYEVQGERFRYMAPLEVERSCLNCHGFQGYRLGDIRGGLAIDLPMHSAIEMTAAGRMVTIIGGIVVIVLVLLTLWILLRRLILHPMKAMEAFASQIGSGREVRLNLPLRSDEVGRLSRVLIATEKEVRNQQQELSKLSGHLDDSRRHDHLTGIHNRRHLYLEGERLMAMARREEFTVSVLILDLDHFKEVNESYGRAAGDRVLIEVAHALQKHSRIYDLLIRFGGEEFAIVVMDCGKDQSMRIAERFLNDIASLAVENKGQMIRVSCSIGVCSSDELEMEQMILAADEASYRARSDGGNRICHSESGGE
ncbi:diguanylate cyclase (GGDEF) domain-containing protein [Mariprofundus ferrinatatus]|uniref:diguanylate cyclase n=1 Tax=Mariprofundus ferrinatatus TaxID=1921087 RepID=A0A2K8L0U9_9PROT|nr:diguanylate cyclase [Mariprofundus ferrinatatus]ATX80918.1 diguanylate cyclase (GGDEF) domain-containing protein [Mariprofundus ferrinatatus]